MAGTRAGLLVAPILFGVYPVLFMVARGNSAPTNLEVVVGLVLGATASIVIAAVAALVTRDAPRAAMLAVAWTAIFFGYGHLYFGVSRIDSRIFDLGSNLYVLALMLVLFLAAVPLTGLLKDRIGKALVFFTAVGTCLVAMALGGIVIDAARGGARGSGAGESTTAASSPDPKGSFRPNVYYIVLDGYAGDDILASMYGFGQNDLTAFLLERGFHVASESRANYALTHLSLASSLDMDYLDVIVGRNGIEATSRADTYRMISESRVMKEFRRRGYRTVLIRSGWGATDRAGFADLTVQCGRFGQFLSDVASTTALAPVDKALGLGFLGAGPRAMVLCSFDKLGALHALKEPFIVLAHILVPHPPYLFGANGEELGDNPPATSADGWESRGRYVDQLRFVNRMTRKAVGRIIERDRTAVVILQSDHGPASLAEWDRPGKEFLRERMSILNAVRFPDGRCQGLYPRVTPVNTFRLVLDSLFGTSYGLLPDRSYFSTHERPFRMTDVTPQMQ